MAQLWEHSSPANVAQVRFLEETSYVGWFLSLLQAFFSSYYGFPPFTNTDSSKFQFDPEPVKVRATFWIPPKFLFIY